MNILHLTTILPSPIKNKIPANDIIIRIATEYEKRYPEDKPHFILILPYTNWFLALFRAKWNEYYQLIRAGNYDLNGIKIYVVGIPAFRKDIKLRRLLTRLGYLVNRKRINAMMGRIRPDLIHAHNLGNNMELAEIIKRKFGCEFVITARNANPYSLARINNNKVTPRKVLALSKPVELQISQSFNNEVSLIPHPVDSEFFNNEMNERPRNNTISLVTVANLLEYKNIDKVIHALSLIGNEYSYTIIGEGPERKRLEKLVSDTGIEDRVRFLGRLPHEVIKRDLRNYDLFILLSYPETLGIVYLEALASGLPVIASKNTGVDGIISHGIQGFLADPMNMNKLADTIKYYMDLTLEKRLQMKRDAVELARHFTWEITLEKYYQLYHS